MSRAKFKNFTIRSDNPHFDSIDGIIYNEAHTEVNIVPMNKTNVKILNGVTNIVQASFLRNESSSIGTYDSEADIKLPNSIRYIQREAFDGCSNIEWIELPSGVQAMYAHVFCGCSKLKSFYIPSTVTTITHEYNGEINPGGYYSILLHCPNVNVYCEINSKPSNWSSYWSGREFTFNSPSSANPAPVVWGVSRETYRANNRYLNN